MDTGGHEFCISLRVSTKNRQMDDTLARRSGGIRGWNRGRVKTPTQIVVNGAAGTWLLSSLMSRVCSVISDTRLNNVGGTSLARES